MTCPLSLMLTKPAKTYRMTLMKLCQPKVYLSIVGGLLISWFTREEITRFLFLGKGFEGRNQLFQLFLLGIYALVFATLSFLFITFLERLDSPGKHAGGILSKYTSYILFAAILLLLIYPLKYAINFLSFPYPLEYREAASIYPAVAFLRGINPYSLQSFPEHIYLYGLLYPLSLAPIIKLVNHPLLVARSYDLLYLVLFLGMSFWIFRKRNASIISSLIGVLILLNSACLLLARNGSRPDVPGLFFAFLGFCFLLNREPDTPHILLCAVSCVVSFYFKQYYLFSTLVIAAFLFLFVSKRKGYFFIAAVITLGLVSFSVIRIFFPLYYEYSILHHVEIATNSVSYMENQSYDFLRYYWVLCSLYLFYLFTTVSAFSLKRLKEIRLVPTKSREPFICGVSADLFDIGILFAVFILTFWLGRHIGNEYTYYGELLLPFLIYLIVPKIDEIFKINLHRNLVQMLLLALCVFPFRVNYVRDFTPWNESFSVLSNYADQCKNILDETPLAAMYKIDHNMFPVYNSGQTNYAQTVIPDRETILGRISLVPADVLNQRLLEWNNAIESGIQRQEFDCIFSGSNQEIGNYKLVAKIGNVLGKTVYFRVPRAP